MRLASATHWSSVSCGAGQVRELLELRARVAADVRHQADELFGGQPAAVLIGDGSAGGDQPDARDFRGRRLALDRGNLGLRGPSRQPERQKKSSDVYESGAHGATIPEGRALRGSG